MVLVCICKLFASYCTTGLHEIVQSNMLLRQSKTEMQSCLPDSQINTGPSCNCQWLSLFSFFQMQGWGFLKEIWQPYNASDYRNIFVGAST